MRPVIVGKGEVRLLLPKTWIDSVEGSEQDGQLLLDTRWPGLTGYHDGHERDCPWDGSTHNGKLTILLTLTTRINSLQERYERSVSFFAPLSRYPVNMGLEHWGKDEAPGAQYTTQREIYFSPSERIDTYVSCYLPGTVPFPSCTAEFYVGPFLAHVTYSRVFLPDWRAIEESIHRSILSFMVTISGQSK